MTRRGGRVLAVRWRTTTLVAVVAATSWCGRGILRLPTATSLSVARPPSSSARRCSYHREIVQCPERRDHARSASVAYSSIVDDEDDSESLLVRNDDEDDVEPTGNVEDDDDDDDDDDDPSDGSVDVVEDSDDDDEHRSADVPMSKADSIAYTLTNELEAIVKAHDASGARVLRRSVLRRADELFSRVPNPNTRSYTFLIQIHGRANSPQRADELLETMMTEHSAWEKNNNNGNSRVKPNTVTFTSVVDAWARCDFRKHPRAAERAYELLQRMLVLHEQGFGGVEPNSVTFDTVLHALSRTDDGGEAAETLLNRMEYFHQRATERRSRSSPSLSRVKPTVVSFTNVVNAWGNMRVGRHNRRAQSILERAEAFHAATKDPDARPNTILLNSVMDAHSRAGDGDAALALLRRMEADLEERGAPVRDDEELDPAASSVPNTVSYNVVLKALLRGDADTTRATELFARVNDFTEAWRRPDARTYNTMLDGLAKKDRGAAGAERVLARQMRALRETGRRDLRPDAVSFATCMNAVAKDRNYPRRARRCREMLDLAARSYRRALAAEEEDDDDVESLRPNVVVYNTVLNAAAFSAYGPEEERREAFLVALRTFNEMRESSSSEDDDDDDDDVDVAPDEVTYGNMFKICANLLDRDDPNRTKMAERLWNDCREAGLVGDMVWNEMKRAVPASVFTKWIPENVHGREDLPKSWRENVGRDDRDRRRGRNASARNKKKKKRPTSTKTKTTTKRKKREGRATAEQTTKINEYQRWSEMVD